MNMILWMILTDLVSFCIVTVLAITLGDFSSPEVHGSGMYGHYHIVYYANGDLRHAGHIWFGGKLRY